MEKKMEESGVKNEFCLDEEKHDIRYWFKEIDWNPRLLKREPTIRPISKSTFTRKCFESSFLFRVFYRYQTYISKYAVNQASGTFVPSGQKILELTNSLTLALEQTILTDYAKSYLTAFPGSLAFPPNVFEFLWNFFMFLNTTDAHLNCIIPLETCPEVYSAFSSALQFSKLNSQNANAHIPCILCIIKHTAVTTKLAKFFRENGISL